MNVYFVRHGESEGNLKKVHQGENVPLSQKGKSQALAVANRLKKISVDVIYASPYLRAKQTAQIISKELNLPIEYWEQLKELRRPSELEGLEYSDPKAAEIKKIIKENQAKPDWKYSNDESFNDLITRAKEVEKHISKHHKDQNVLCVSHIQIMVMIVMQMIMQDKLTPEVFWQFYYHCRQKNTGITHLEYTDTFGWNLVTWNDTKKYCQKDTKTRLNSQIRLLRTQS